MSYDETIKAGLAAALPYLSAPCAVEVDKLHWDGLVGFVGSLSYVVAPPSLTKGWRVWGKLSDKSASVGGVLITTTAADEEEAKAAAQADFERRILSCVVTKPVDVAAVRRQTLKEAYTRAATVVKKQLEVSEEYAWDEADGLYHTVINLIDTHPDIIRALSAKPAQGDQWQPTHRHVKRGTEYHLIGIGKMQTERWIEPGIYPKPGIADMREVVVYRSVDDGSLWVRPIEEFNDGRFETLPAASTTEAGNEQ